MAAHMARSIAKKHTPRICVVGLGYVGLPLVHAFGKTGWPTYGYDVSERRIRELRAGRDSTGTFRSSELRRTAVTLSADPRVIAEATVVIVAVPTPIDDASTPDLGPVVAASQTVGSHMGKGTIVVFESTVYPGVTEEVCIPILEQHSGLRCGRDFTVGYSPERVNPGDREHTLEKIVKVVAGQDDATCAILVEVYGRIIPAGIHRAPSIKVAEMAKVIENTQRDINVALMNEIAMLCDRLGIRTADVLAAARTKWNFLPFTPGLVGGHCISVDPYYLVHCAKRHGLHSDVITAGRRVNDIIPTFIERKVIHLLVQQETTLPHAKVLVLGLTFKENVPDLRNSKALHVVRKLTAMGCDVHGNDPMLSRGEIASTGAHPFALTKERATFDAILLLVPHEQYRSLTAKTLKRWAASPCVLYDLKSRLDPLEAKAQGFTYASL